MTLLKRPLGVALIFLFAIIIPARLTTAATPQLGEPIDLTGVLRGAEYEIRVPANWNGTLLVYAHGYRDKASNPGEVDDTSADAAPGGDATEEALLALGYALAGSGYRSNGWAVGEAIQDTRILTEFFSREVGAPDRVILWGFSMGSLVAFASAERFPDVYDGVISACAVGAGAPRAWDAGLVMNVAYDVTFGWPVAWGSPGDVPDNIDFETAIAPTLLGQVINPANFGQFEFIRLVSSLPAEEFYSGANWLFTDFFFGTEARGELERRAGGPVAQNLNHVYSLDAAEIGYLAALGVDAIPLLDAMNDQTTIAADPAARDYVEANADYSGAITVPVLTLHTIGDGLVPVQHEAAYLATVTAAGQTDNLVQTYTDAVGHCAFTPEQLLATLTAMNFWLDSGSAPTDVFFPAALGFLPGFEPEPWPFP